MAKGAREKIKLESSAGTGHFYTTSKNKRTKPEKRVCRKKYCETYALPHCSAPSNRCSTCVLPPHPPVLCCAVLCSVLSGA